MSFNASGASNTVTVQLQPAELGKVQITVTTDATGASAVQVLAERPETLALLQRDQVQLSQALDQAGIAGAGRSMSFNLSTPAAATAGQASAPSATATAGGSNPATTMQPATSLGAAASETVQSTAAPTGLPTGGPGNAGAATVTGLATAAPMSGGFQNSSSGNSGFQPPPNAGSGLGLNGGAPGNSGNNSGSHFGGQGGFQPGSQVLGDIDDPLGDDTANIVPPSWLPNSLNIFA